MNYDELNKKFKQLNIEDFIWLIYIGIIFLSWYSNSLERKYFIYKNPNLKNKYQKIMILIFSILIIVYLYFLKDAWDSVKELKPCDSEKKKKLVYLSFFGSLLIAISGAIFLFIACNDQSLDVELAFN